MEVFGGVLRTNIYSFFFLPEKLLVGFKIIQDPLKCHFCQNELFVTVCTSTAFPPLLYNSILLTHSFKQVFIEYLLWIW